MLIRFTTRAPKLSSKESLRNLPRGQSQSSRQSLPQRPLLGLPWTRL